MATFTDLLPTIQAAGTAREARLLELIEQGHAVHRWAALSVQHNGHTIELEVSEDALALGDATDSVRINVTATTAQRIADRFDALLLTPKIADLIHERATLKLSPSNRAPGPQMGSLAWMIEHSRAVDVKKAGEQGLTSNAGKDWVLTNRLITQPDRSANYGWYVPTSQFPAATGGLFVLQPVGLAHNRFHVDYSQTWRGVKRACKVDGAARDLADVLADPALASALCHEGVLRVFRQPGVPSASTGPASPIAETPPPPRDPVAAVPRILRRGMQGADVAAWQRTLGLTDDGVFGPKTEEATKRFQAEHGLAADGVVGPMTRAAANKGQHPFVEARNKRVGRTGNIDLVVIHTMEAKEKPNTAENVAAWFAGPHAPMASAHYCVDADSIVQCVRESDTAFHAPGANHNGVGIEHAGYANQTPEDWADPYSQTMLRRSAELTASICKRYGIPVTFVDATQLLSNARGITTHAAVSIAFKRSDHTDPGKSFPMEAYLEMVREYLG